MNDRYIGNQILDLPKIYSFSQDVAKGLQALMSYEGNVEEDMGLTFQVYNLLLRPCKDLRGYEQRSVHTIDKRNISLLYME